jgi:hypothetical protein
MCGDEGSVRIEPADNGFMVNAYTPGGEGKPGKHRRMVATSPEHAMRLAMPHLRKVGKKGRKGRGGVISQEGAIAKGRKRARKRV